MTSVLLDTQVWAWSINEPRRLSASASAAIADAATRLVCPISVYEIGQKVRLGKWPEMTPLVPRLAQIALDQGAQFAALTAALCYEAAMFAWPHRDPFDRIIAATALAENAALISSDTAFDALPALRRIWT